MDFPWIWAYTLTWNYFAKEWNADASEKKLIFVKLQVCLYRYLEYLV